MLSKADRSKAARILLDAEKQRKPALQLSKTFPGITIEDAYAIQSEVTRLKVAAGHRVRGDKVGLTSKAMQQSSQIDEPDYGHLMDYMFIADGAKIPFERFIVPRVEIELAFVLGKPLKGATLIGIGPEALKNVTRVGNDPKPDPGLGTCGKDGQGVPVGVGQPTLRMDGLTVGGTAA